MDWTTTGLNVAPISWEVHAIRDGVIIIPTWDWDDVINEVDSDWVRCKVVVPRDVPNWREGQHVFIKRASPLSPKSIYCSLKDLGLVYAPREVTKEPTIGWNFHVKTTDGHQWFLQKMEHHATKKITWCVIREYGAAWNFDTWAQVLSCIGAYATITGANSR